MKLGAGAAVAPQPGPDQTQPGLGHSLSGYVHGEWSSTDVAVAPQPQPLVPGRSTGTHRFHQCRLAEAPPQAPGAPRLERVRAPDGAIRARPPGPSVWIGGQQLPLCARTSGIYPGFASTIALLFAPGRIRSSRLPVPWVAALLGLAVLFMAVDG